jgi:hypothetical protein
VVDEGIEPPPCSHLELILRIRQVCFHYTNPPKSRSNPILRMNDSSAPPRGASGVSPDIGPHNRLGFEPKSSALLAAILPLEDRLLGWARQGLNLRPIAYQAIALPLSYMPVTAEGVGLEPTCPFFRTTVFETVAIAFLPTFRVSYNMLQKVCQDNLRRGQDLNLRRHFYLTVFPGLLFKPLTHLSIFSVPLQGIEPQSCGSEPHVLPLDQSGVNFYCSWEWIRTTVTRFKVWHPTSWMTQELILL